MRAIEVNNISFVYSKKTPYEKRALDNVSLNIEEGEFVGIIGHTGSGKSTFIQHLNGLIKPESGQIKIFDTDITAKKPKPNLKKLRGDVGMVFQYPEYQLFDDTVEKDVGFGCRNMKLDKPEIEKRVKDAITLVGLDYDDIRARSPFDLSGGQKRRVAIAGVIAMNPRILILDEPTAGLDPSGKEQILNMIVELKRERGLTVIIVSHDIDEIVRFADRLIVFNEAKIAFDLPMNELFERADELIAMGLDIPLAVKLKQELKDNGITLDGDIINDEELVNSIIAYAREKGLELHPAEKKVSQTVMLKASKPVEDFDFFGGDR